MLVTLYSDSLARQKRAFPRVALERVVFPGVCGVPPRGLAGKQRHRRHNVTELGRHNVTELGRHNVTELGRHNVTELGRPDERWETEEERFARSRPDF